MLVCGSLLTQCKPGGGLMARPGNANAATYQAYCESGLKAVSTREKRAFLRAKGVRLRVVTIVWASVPECHQKAPPRRSVH